MNAVSTWLIMVCVMSSPCLTLTTNRNIGIYLSISTYSLWIKWNSISRSSSGVLSRINTWFVTWHGQERTLESPCHMIFFRSYWNWYRWHKLDLRSMSPPWLQLFPILMLLCRIIWTIWSVSNSNIFGGECCRIICCDIGICWATWERQSL